MTTTSNPKKNFQTDVTKEKLAGYVNAKANVARYVTALQNTNISGVNFKVLPKDIQDKLPENPATLLKTVNTNLATAKNHGLYWSNEIQPNLTFIPQTIINYSTQFKIEVGIINPLLVALSAKDDPAKRAEVKELLQGLLAKIEAQQTSITTEMTKLKKFNTDVTDDHNNFSKANGTFAAIQTFEKANIKSLNTAITGLDSAISSLNTAITAEAIAVGASVGLIAGGGLLMANVEATPAAEIAGACIMVVGMIGLGVSIGELVSSIDKKQAAEQKKAFDQLEVTELTVQVQALNTVETALKTLVTQSKLAMSSVQVILDTWATLSAKISAVIADLENTEKKIGDIMSIVDLDTAVEQWGQLQTFANQMQAMDSAVLAKPATTMKLNNVGVKVKKVA
ncbi:HBL/NHE enterotoxin family protein [Shewanella psychropiezotolerans]|uniref:HBL/NHE enterotoxin family protein n=1 Tax=Shewanella psychropiezotolerans TaxID=2593655 RepID=A0ABX5WXK7_9GAMM|nr:MULTISPECIES: HBL/NHE enterotoxin family protein [Shewanella]MPY24513.1 HBL/NHE enterotoxin family protein [Shewanella sp. YLB-07]QDO82453.1 HBL/NHE enterotoxin family protein [Shewanella psychropiezotolerans]